MVSKHALRQTTPPPVNRIIDACENITLPQLRCGAVINILSVGEIAIFVSNDTRITSISWQIVYMWFVYEICIILKNIHQWVRKLAHPEKLTYKGKQVFVIRTGSLKSVSIPPLALFFTNAKLTFRSGILICEKISGDKCVM